MTNETPTRRWHIDPDWLEQHNRSFLSLVQCCLCPKCVERAQKGKKTPSVDELVASVQKCCSQAPGFIGARLPVMEGIFRVLMANGNEPLGLEELGDRLAQWRSEDYAIASSALERLLENDRYYGLRPVD